MLDATIQNQVHWWQEIIMVLDPILGSIKQSSTRLTPAEVNIRLDKIHHAYSVVHRVTMPLDIQAQLIAALSNLQTSYCARSEGDKRQSSKHHRIAQVEWVLFEEMLQREGIICHILQ